MARAWTFLELFSRLPMPLRASPPGEGQPIEALCRELLGAKGEVSGLARASEILARWRAAGPERRLNFFRVLAEEFDIEASELQRAAAAYGETRDARGLARVIGAAEPKRQELLRRLNQAPGATADLVAMRVELMRHLKAEPALARVDLDFRHLFASWFNRGFLVLRRIDWDTPAAILERIIRYEAVHEIHSWEDLRARVDPEDRSCFAFFHPALPDDPLIFVEVALTKGVPSAIAPILAEGRVALPAEEADTAVFYSISNCQEGLRGISFGNSLIKQVVAVLREDLPQLKTFVTLSPIPGLRDWLAEQTEDAEAQALLVPPPEDAPDPSREARLKRLAARYLLNAKARDGQPRDPVARFHLGNGAEVHDLHAGADLTPKGLRQSLGAMVNYRYDLATVEANHEACMVKGEVAASRRVAEMAAGQGAKGGKGFSAKGLAATGLAATGLGGKGLAAKDRDAKDRDAKDRDAKDRDAKDREAKAGPVKAQRGGDGAAVKGREAS